MSTLEPLSPSVSAASLGTARSEKFVLDVEQVPAFGEEMPTAAQAHGMGARGPVERFGHRRPPVHHQRFVVGVR